MKKLITLGVALIFCFALLAGCGGEEEKQAAAPKEPAKPTTTFVTIGTGGITGVYYPTGGAIAKIVNQKKGYLPHPLHRGIHGRIGV